jgi:hypothetical protein
MFAISFRIPFTILNTVQYVNGSALSSKKFEKGDIISIVDKSRPSEYSALEAVVIESVSSRREYSSFKWGII